MLYQRPFFMALQDKTVVLDLWASVSLGVWILAGERHHFTWRFPKQIVPSYLSMQTSVVFAPNAYIYLLSLSHLAVNTSKKRAMSPTFILTAYKT